MTPSKASARMTPAEHCGTAAYAPPAAPASEVTPVEAAAQALALARHEAKKTPQTTWPWEDIARVALTVALSGDWLERVLGEHADFTYVDTYPDPAHFVCDCGHPFGYEDGAHAEWEAHLAAAIRTAAGATR